VDPFAGDKVLFTITKANAAQYKEKLTPGTLAMLDKYDNFKMNVYQTRRTACYPQAVYDNVKAQAGKVELQGFGIANRGPSTVPFPIPKSGLEAIWNHTMRYLGGGIDRNYHSFPVRANGDFYKIGAQEYRIFNENMDQPQDNLLLGFLSRFTAPATLEGTVFLVHEPVDQVKQARSRGSTTRPAPRAPRARPRLRQHQRRHRGPAHHRPVRRLQRCARPLRLEDRRQEGDLRSYNAFKLSDKKLRYKEDLIRKNTPNADLLRYELHRVWEVEANLKAGSKHVYGKRVFFIDEDTWTVLYEDAYDTRKQLWRVSIHPLMQFYDAKVPWYRANIWHDLTNGSYLFSLLDNEVKVPWKFGEKGKWADFQPDALRRIGTK